MLLDRLLHPVHPWHKIVRSAEDLEVMVRCMKGARRRGFDFEATGLNPHQGDYPIGYTFGRTYGEEHRCWYVPVAHKVPEEQIPLVQAKAAFGDIVNDTAMEWELIGQNLKFDILTALWNDWPLPLDIPLHDTMGQAFLTWPHQRLRLEILVAQHRPPHLPWDDPFEKSNLVKDFCRAQAQRYKMPLERSSKTRGGSYMETHGHAEVPICLEGEYSCRDVAHALRLDDVLRPQAQQGPTEHWTRQRRWLYANEMKLVWALVDMEMAGQPLDVDILQELAWDLDLDLARRGKELDQLFKVNIDWNNENQIRDLLYDHLRLPVVRRTKRSKEPAVDRSALMLLRKHHPGIEHLAEYRVRAKVRSTYTDQMTWQVGKDGRVHPNFNQWRARTGRFSASEPNLQNIPTRHKEMAQRVRRAFTVPPGKVRLFADYSQVELRFLAWITQSRTFLEAYHSPLYEAWVRGDIDYETYRCERRHEPSVDVHGRQAVNTFGSSPDSPNWKIERRAAKVINFGVPYGMTWVGLMESPELLLDEAAAKRYYDTYHRQNPEIRKTIRQLMRAMRQDPQSRFFNWVGLPSYEPAVRAEEDWKLRMAEREQFAGLVQGSAAAVTRCWIVRLYDLQRRGLLPGRSTSTVHDEVQVDCDVQDLRECALVTQREGERFPGYFGNVPIIVDLDTTTTNWAEKKEYDLWAA